MAERATNRDLSKALGDHLEDTRKQIGRLEQVFKTLGEAPRRGLIDEAEEVAGETEDNAVLDAAIVGSAQAVEHYEMARYGTLIAWAEELGRDDVVRLLTTNLNEEKAADKKLSTAHCARASTVGPRARRRRNSGSVWPRTRPHGRGGASAAHACGRA